ncbi:TIGR01777 family oxidoreductase [Xenophilus aerolatus]|nr:TIGR01777 family oxidoreductase [Xenophilus aerolatus]
MSRTVLVTGATGFVGGHLVAALLADGHQVIAATRDATRARRRLGQQVQCVTRLADLASDSRIDACVQLAGARVLGPPWTRARRETLLRSRAEPAAQLLALMRRLDRPPAVLVVASAIGWYGRVDNAADAPCDESEPPRPGQFQSELCMAIERDARQAEALGVRVVCLRLGVVLGHDGGAYPPQALAARLGLGAVLGDGRHPAPWVHVDDVVALTRLALAREDMAGPVNVVAPHVPSQAEFVHAMAASYGRGVHLRMPAPALRLALGEMGDLLLAGRHVVPAVATLAGYGFAFPALAPALEDLAARTRRRR